MQNNNFTGSIKILIRKHSFYQKIYNLSVIYTARKPPARNITIELVFLELITYTMFLLTTVAYAVISKTKCQRTKISPCTSWTVQEGRTLCSTVAVRVWQASVLALAFTLLFSSQPKYHCTQDRTFLYTDREQHLALRGRQIYVTVSLFVSTPADKLVARGKPSYLNMIILNNWVTCACGLVSSSFPLRGLPWPWLGHFWKQRSRTVFLCLHFKRTTEAFPRWKYPPLRTCTF